MLQHHTKCFSDFCLKERICNMIDIILLLLVIAAVGAAIAYIIKEKKKGAVCIGCSMSGCCSKKNSGGCGSQKAEKE